MGASVTGQLKTEMHKDKPPAKSSKRPQETAAKSSTKQKTSGSESKKWFGKSTTSKTNEAKLKSASSPSLNNNNEGKKNDSKNKRPLTVLLGSPTNITLRKGQQSSKIEGQTPEDLSRASSITNLNVEPKGAKAKPKKAESRDRLDKIGEKKNERKTSSSLNKNNNKDNDSDTHQEIEQLQKQLMLMANEKCSLALQLGEQTLQLNNLHGEVAKLKMLQEQANQQLDQLGEENSILRNRLRDVAHSPLSDNEKQQLLYESRHHSSAPASIATNLLDEGGDVTACPTPDWDKHSSSNVSEISVACLQDKINQMQETHYSTNEELQATLQELTDLQKQLTELQQENERLLEEKNLMFESLCRQTERLKDSRNEVESLKQLLYKDESGQFETAAEREQKLVDLLKSVQEERENLLMKQEQLGNDLQDSRSTNVMHGDEIVQLSERVKTLESTLDAKHAEHKQLDRELTLAKDQSSGRQIEINRLKDLLENARTKIGELEQDRQLGDKSELDELLDNARKEKDALESEVAHHKEQLALSKNETEKLKEQVSVLQEECKVIRNNAKTTQSDLEYKVEKLLLEKNGLAEQLQQFQEAVNELQVQSQCQLEDKRQLSAVLSETQRNLNESERKVMSLETELNEVKRLRQDQEEEWERFQNDLLTSVRVANDFKTEAQQDLQRMIMENKAERERVKQLEAQIDKLKGGNPSKLATNPTKRSQVAAGKKQPRQLSKEEELLMELLGKRYEEIDPNVPDDQLTEEQKVIKKLKTLYESEPSKQKPVARKAKDKLAISKPLLNSVISNPKLEEIANDPKVFSVERASVRHLDDFLDDLERLRGSNLPKLPSENSPAKSRSLNDLETPDEDFDFRSFVEESSVSLPKPGPSSGSLPKPDSSSKISSRSSESSRGSPQKFLENSTRLEGSSRSSEDSKSGAPISDSSTKELPKSLLVESRQDPNRSSEERGEIELSEFPFEPRGECPPLSFSFRIDPPEIFEKLPEDSHKIKKNRHRSVVTFETLEEICNSIDPDTPEELLTKEQRLALRLRVALSERKATLKKNVKISRKKIVISSPVKESVVLNSKLLSFMEDPIVPCVVHDSFARENRLSAPLDVDVERTSQSSSLKSKSYDDISFTFKNSINMYSEDEQGKVVKILPPQNFRDLPRPPESPKILTTFGTKPADSDTESWEDESGYAKVLEDGASCCDTLEIAGGIKENYGYAQVQKKQVEEENCPPTLKEETKSFDDVEKKQVEEGNRFVALKEEAKSFDNVQKKQVEEENRFVALKEEAKSFDDVEKKQVEEENNFATSKEEPTHFEESYEIFEDDYGYVTIIGQPTDDSSSDDGFQETRNFVLNFKDFEEEEGIDEEESKARKEVTRVYSKVVDEIKEKYQKGGEKRKKATETVDSSSDDDALKERMMDLDEHETLLVKGLIKKRSGRPLSEISLEDLLMVEKLKQKYGDGSEETYGEPVERESSSEESDEDIEKAKQIYENWEVGKNCKKETKDQIEDEEKITKEETEEVSSSDENEERVDFVENKDPKKEEASEDYGNETRNEEEPLEKQEIIIATSRNEREDTEEVSSSDEDEKPDDSIESENRRKEETDKDDGNENKGEEIIVAASRKESEENLSSSGEDGRNLVVDYKNKEKKEEECGRKVDSMDSIGIEDTKEKKRDENVSSSSDDDEKEEGIVGKRREKRNKFERRESNNVEDVEEAIRIVKTDKKESDHKEESSGNDDDKEEKIVGNRKETRNNFERRQSNSDEDVEKAMSRLAKNDKRKKRNDKEESSSDDDDRRPTIVELTKIETDDDKATLLENQKRREKPVDSYDFPSLTPFSLDEPTVYEPVYANFNVNLPKKNETGPLIPKKPLAAPRNTSIFESREQKIYEEFGGGVKKSHFSIRYSRELDEKKIQVNARVKDKKSVTDLRKMFESSNKPKVLPSYDSLDRVADFFVLNNVPNLTKND